MHLLAFAPPRIFSLSLFSVFLFFVAKLLASSAPLIQAKKTWHLPRLSILFAHTHTHAQMNTSFFFECA